MKRILITFLLIFGVLLAGGIQHAQAQSSSEGQNATITITEYSDYECPACAYFHPIVEKLKEKFGDKIEFNLKFYPLNSHQYAALAARAAQSAKNQGKFLEMHNLLFENQQQWVASGNPTPIFINYARELNLDIEQFKDELNAAETQRSVMEERNEGRQAGVNSTPTFFIEGEKIDPLPRTYAQFEQVVQQYLSKNKSG